MTPEDWNILHDPDGRVITTLLLFFVWAWAAYWIFPMLG